MAINATCDSCGKPCDYHKVRYYTSPIEGVKVKVAFEITGDKVLAQAVLCNECVIKSLDMPLAF